MSERGSVRRVRHSGHRRRSGLGMGLLRQQHQRRPGHGQEAGGLLGDEGAVAALDAVGVQDVPPRFSTQGVPWIWTGCGFT